ncbi:hypothetical protein SISSUDRAFT_1056428 [Sistotremastrum suecicum HHB10207 ss-3]|uniref:Uncharacterized protein n=1 Tax=Sistotremastrum suecicum HHB10207 ss-3 TaxID=1314776 RepID=A0A165WV83_9AGAM|nr:hypothetical protein SISSUDRAFT_1056428 [Sistotremastrum suecicum HHB10207 ss-3]
MSSNTSSNNSENTRTLPVTIFTFTDNEIFSDIPGLAPNSRPIVPRNVPYLELNPAVNFFLTPTLVVHKCEKIRLPDGQIRRMLPAGLAHALYYNLEVLRDYVRYSFTSEKYPAGIIHTVIPAELLHQLQLPHPPVLLHSHENPLLRSYSEAEIVGVVHQFQLKGDRLGLPLHGGMGWVLGA